jgi:hypothetical protein
MKRPVEEQSASGWPIGVDRSRRIVHLCRRGRRTSCVALLWEADSILT